MGPDGTPGGRPRGREWPSDPEAIRARLNTIRNNADETLRKFVEAREEAGDLTSEGYSEDGSVRVEVDDNGQVIAIDIPDSALGRLSQLGYQVVTAIKAASVAHAQKMAEIAGKMGLPGGVMSMMKDSIPGEGTDSADRRY